jgi:hypothetical protein
MTKQHLFEYLCPICGGWFDGYACECCDYFDPDRLKKIQFPVKKIIKKRSVENV